LNPSCVPMGDYYFCNLGVRFEEKGRFEGGSDYGIGRGSVVFDLENDGDLDILVVNQKPVLAGYPVESTTRLLRNDETKGNWIKIALKGVEAESHGLGSKIEIVVNGKHQIREIDGGGSSHLSQNTSFDHFGVGNATEIEEIIIHWTGGNKQVLKHQKANQTLIITEEKHLSLFSIVKWAAVGLIVLIGILYFWRKTRKK